MLEGRGSYQRKRREERETDLLQGVKRIEVGRRQASPFRRRISEPRDDLPSPHLHPKVAETKSKNQRRKSSGGRGIYLWRTCGVGSPLSGAC